MHRHCVWASLWVFGSRDARGWSCAPHCPSQGFRGRTELARVNALPFSFGLGARLQVLPKHAPVKLALRAGASAAPIRIVVDATDPTASSVRTFWTGLAHAGVAVEKHWGRVFLVANAGADLPLLAPRILALGEIVHDLAVAWPHLDLAVGTRW